MKKQTLRTWAKMALTLALLSSLAVCAWAQTPKRLLVVSVTKGFRHDVIPSADQMLADLAQMCGKFTVDYVRTDDDMSKKMTTEALKDYDGVVFNNTTGDLPIPDPDAFLEWIKSGKAFIGLHAAADTLPNFPAYTEMLGAHFKTHEAQVEVEALNQDPYHPATRNWGPCIRVFDEIYQFKDFHRDQVHGLLTMDKHPNSKIPGDYPISWCKAYGQGRVFYTSLGHRIDVVNPNTPADYQRLNSPEVALEYRQHVLGGILWALGIEEGSAEPQSTAYSVNPRERREGFEPLFDGVDLSGWHLRHADGRDSWSVQDGMLVNQVTKDEHGTDLVSDRKFKDFTVRYEYMIPKGANSGFYLRGRYEIQILDDYPGHSLSPTSDGSFYNFAAPSSFASREPGRWNQVEATIRGNRATVILNHVKIHDDVELTRPTGGQLDNDVDQPGPIFLQGDHGCVAFRNIRIKGLN
ncbi:MAG: ThuA domain-containing protein [Candidatus Omnitrophica bacterium]|nr:ThuA domain-containing protein [Candidatus Omnitrophota bacterium]